MVTPRETTEACAGSGANPTTTAVASRTTGMRVRRDMSGLQRGSACAFARWWPASQRSYRTVTWQNETFQMPELSLRPGPPAHQEGGREGERDQQYGVCDRAGD